ncbi:MAG: ADP-ribosylglycohydrolase family protein, partial [Deltaproteobacteria bacterium]|nr:ADP-ribosylglycohydrolase family protein [Deltaproteobacteria bacterium]
MERLKMLGAIIGDIVGSRFEWNNIKTKEFEFLNDRCFFTDDSVLTAAVGHAILVSGGNYENLGLETVKAMRGIGRLYPGCGYGGRFNVWLFSEDPEPYNSFGNGSAMRVSPCGLAAKSLEETKLLSRLVTEVTHNHPEGIKGAEATATSVFLARTGWEKEKIKDFVVENYYPLDFTLDSIRADYQFNEICQDTVPQALVAFFESRDYEEAIRGAISIGGDSDTLAAIAG